MKKYAALTVFIFTFAIVHAQQAEQPQTKPQQNAPQYGAQYSAQNTGAILIPRIIYVGDPAVLVLPLPASIKNSDDVILTSLSPHIPKDDNIDFHRITLERREKGSRLLIEFTAFVPGYLKLPVIEIGGEYFDGLYVTVNSVIDTRKSLELSGYASSLAMPGTAVILYGAMAAVAFILLLLLWFILKGRVFLELWIEKWKRRRLFTFIKNMERRLQKALLKGGNKRAILDKISDTFRDFLSVLTNANCRSMTAREFVSLPEKLIKDGGFLGDFFRRCDKFRFSGEDVKLRDVSSLLDDLNKYIEKLYLLENSKVSEPQVREPKVSEPLVREPIVREPKGDAA